MYGFLKASRVMLMCSKVLETLIQILPTTLEGRYNSPSFNSGTSKIQKLNKLSNVIQPISVKERTEFCLIPRPVLFHELICCANGICVSAGQREEGDPALDK